MPKRWPRSSRVRRAVDELGLTRVISFHTTIKRAHDFARELERLELDAPAGRRPSTSAAPCRWPTASGCWHA